MNITLPLRKGRGGQTAEWKELYQESLRTFAGHLKALQANIDFNMSVRGWCYVLEPYGLSKADFDWMQGQFNYMRRIGLIEPKFILEEEGHKVEAREDWDWSPQEYVDDEFSTWKTAKETFENCADSYGSGRTSFWDNKKYFIQLLVEKSDLKSLFRDMCNKYKIPIANMRGWGSMEQKAEMARRFQEHEEEGRMPILLACCDFDPPGLKISDILKETFEHHARFSGWNPRNLVVDRVGLNFDFIQEHKLSWIDGLTTISGKNLADPNHKFYKSNTYGIRDYIADFGARKCEANAIVIVPQLGRAALKKKIEHYLGEDCMTDFLKKIKERKEEIQNLVDIRMEDEEEDEE